MTESAQNKVGVVGVGQACTPIFQAVLHENQNGSDSETPGTDLKFRQTESGYRRITSERHAVVYSPTGGGDCAPARSGASE